MYNGSCQDELTLGLCMCNKKLESMECLRWLQIVRVWLLVRFSVFPLIYSCAGNICGKLVKGCDKLVKGRGKLFKGRGRVIKGHADRSLHLGKTF